MKLSFVLLAACAAVVAGEVRGTFGSTFTLNNTTYTTEFNTGSGPDHALMVLQYGGAAGPETTYAFGYSWDPTAGPQDGHDMLLAITANSGGTMVPHIEFFTLPDDPDVQPFVDTIDYLTNVPAPYNFPFPFDSTTTGFSWTGYFTSDGGSDWTAPELGDLMRPLADGSADDWVYQDIAPDEDFNSLVTPAFAIATPEAGSLGLLAVGLMGFARRRSSR
jgi:hypothetical protein